MREPAPLSALTRRLPDTIADVRPSGRVLRVLQELARIAREADRQTS